MKKILQTLSLTALALIYATNAHALLSVTLTDLDTGDTVSVTDNGPGDLSGVVGRMGLWGDIGNWSYFTGAAGAPYVGDDSFDEFDLFSMNVKKGGTGVGTLAIELLATGIMRDEAPYHLGIGGTAAGTIHFATYIDGVLVSNTGSLSGAFSFKDFGSVADGLAPYDLRVLATISSGNNTETSFNYKMIVPEPGVLSLLGLGLFGLGLFTRKKQRT